MDADSSTDDLGLPVLSDLLLCPSATNNDYAVELQHTVIRQHRVGLNIGDISLLPPFLHFAKRY